MMSNFNVGDRVRILETAFPGSDDPDDILARGKIGTIVTDLSEYLAGYEGCYEVELDDVPDEMDAIFPIETNEMKAI